MGEIFGNIYCWFESLFGVKLADYLWGYECGTESFSNSNGFIGIGIITLGVSLLLAIIYYYGINHPRFNRFWSWLLMLIINAAIAFFWGYQWVASAFLNEQIGDCLMYERDAEGEIILRLINISDCWMFGVANLIISLMFFVIISLIINILGKSVPSVASRNCKYSPF